jgi:hypothetical protein
MSCPPCGNETLLLRTSFNSWKETRRYKCQQYEFLTVRQDLTNKTSVLMLEHEKTLTELEKSQSVLKVVQEGLHRDSSVRVAQAPLFERSTPTNNNSPKKFVSFKN